MRSPRVVTKPGKILLIWEDGRALVIKIRKQVDLIPRWRVASGLFLSSMFAGAAAALHQPLIAFPFFAVAFVCLWALR